jgi:hypothetical protein
MLSITLMKSFPQGQWHCLNNFSGVNIPLNHFSRAWMTQLIVSHCNCVNDTSITAVSMTQALQQYQWHKHYSSINDTSITAVSMTQALQQFQWHKHYSSIHDISITAVSMTQALQQYQWHKKSWSGFRSQSKKSLKSQWKLNEKLHWDFNHYNQFVSSHLNKFGCVTDTMEISELPMTPLNWLLQCKWHWWNE